MEKKKLYVFCVLGELGEKFSLNPQESNRQEEFSQSSPRAQSSQPGDSLSAIFQGLRWFK
jgi:hypothetical protein